MADVDLSLRELGGDESALVEHPTLSNKALKRFTEALLAGQQPTEAAKTAGTTLKALRAGGRRVREKLAALKDYAATPEELRELVLGTWVERVIESDDPRERMAALNELSKVPELGLKGAPKGVARELAPETMELLDREE